MGNAPRGWGIRVQRRLTRGALPTRLNEPSGINLTDQACWLDFKIRMIQMAPMISRQMARIVELRPHDEDNSSVR